MTPDIVVEREVVSKVQKAALDKDFGNACFEAGKFIESVATQAYQDLNGTLPKNAKEAIDFLISQKLVSRPLGFKLHVARELRNAEAHKLPYQITLNDMETAVDALNKLIEWLHQGNLAMKWLDIVNDFERIVKQRSESGDHRNFYTLRLQSTMEFAVEMKLNSMGVPSDGKGRRGFFSGVKQLVDNGIDIKSEAWRHLVQLRNHTAHSPPGDIPPADLTEEEIEELRGVLEKLNPLPAGLKKIIEYPQVNLS